MSNKRKTRTIRAIISEREFLRLFVEILYPKASTAVNKQRTFYLALSHLIGISDVEAVKIANVKARAEGLETITTDEFRKWLPKVFSQLAGEAYPNE